MYVPQKLLNEYIAFKELVNGKLNEINNIRNQFEEDDNKDFLTEMSAINAEYRNLRIVLSTVFEWDKEVFIKNAKTPEKKSKIELVRAEKLKLDNRLEMLLSTQNN